MMNFRELTFSERNLFEVSEVKVSLQCSSKAQFSTHFKTPIRFDTWEDWAAKEGWPERVPDSPEEEVGNRRDSGHYKQLDMDRVLVLGEEEAAGKLEALDLEGEEEESGQDWVA